MVEISRLKNLMKFINFAKNLCSKCSILKWPSTELNLFIKTLQYIYSLDLTVCSHRRKIRRGVLARFAKINNYTYYYADPGHTHKHGATYRAFFVLGFLRRFGVKKSCPSKNKKYMPTPKKVNEPTHNSKVLTTVLDEHYSCEFQSWWP